ncbi:sigma-70 family RNA polymerase sigma factor [Nonomuraea sp. NPDC049152]|uniref:sigma-70 family RNA polymerase sigma factor n=1 Tax=Nonomuraea sp. NPDC049152 TaxID=3154350 RepID=UPI00340BA7DE
MSVEPPQSDADLLESARTGNAAAFGDLWKRHVGAARSLARQMVDGEDVVEDVVAESFTKIIELVGRGEGPEAAFRPYLLTVVRRTIYDRDRVESRQVTTRKIELFDPGVPFVDPALTGLERSLLARAYLSLPERWRLVLWHTQVENTKPADVAPMLGLSANGVAALAYRAREGLRQAYLQMHLAGAPHQACRPVLGKMGAYVRGGLTRRDNRLVDEHIDDCGECRAVFLELADVDQGLRVIVGPLFVGPFYAAYVAGLAKEGVTGGGLLHALGWIRRAPKRRQAALAGGVTVAVAAAAVVVLASDDQPLPPRALPTIVPQPSPVRPDPEPAQSRPRHKPRLVPPPVEAPTPAEQSGKAKLRASIQPLGALVKAEPGIVAVRLRNKGKAASEELVALVDLPEGVTLVPTHARGNGVGTVEPVGTVDGWSCAPEGGGARCVRGPLAAGRTTAVFLRVEVAAHAPEGSGPAVRVSSAGVSVNASASAGVKAEGAPARFATDGKVVVRAVGNTLLTCPAEHAGCGETRQGREQGRRDNDLWPMVALDADDVPSTRSSSSARLRMPDGGRVVWAGLYWSGSVKRPGPIKFRAAGAKRYRNVLPDQVVRRQLPSGPGYQAFADVTELVSDSARKGTWWAADAPMREGVSEHAGWSLVVIATDPRRPYSQALVLDAATVVGGDESHLDLPLGGLIPAASPADIELVTWEGDADLRGDRVSAGTSVGGDRDEGNVFDSSSNGATGMTFGVDVDSFKATLADQPSLKISTERDVVLFGVAAVSVPARS